MPKNGIVKFKTKYYALKLYFILLNQHHNTQYKWNLFQFFCYNKCTIILRTTYCVNKKKILTHYGVCFVFVMYYLQQAQQINALTILFSLYSVRIEIYQNFFILRLFLSQFWLLLSINNIFGNLHKYFVHNSLHFRSLRYITVHCHVTSVKLQASSIRCVTNRSSNLKWIKIRLAGLYKKILQPHSIAWITHNIVPRKHLHYLQQRLN